MNLLTEKKRELLSLLPDPDTGISLSISKIKMLLSPNSSKFGVLVVIEGHFKKFKRDQLQGIISYENATLTENGIRQRLVDLISSLKESDFPFIDSRDGQVYNTIELLGKTWMAENMNFDVGLGCMHYGNNKTNGKKYGRLYTLEAAKKACPIGWHLPTNEEWEGLFNHYDGLYDREKKSGGKESYLALSHRGNSGFNVLLGGHGDDYGCGNIDRFGFYWADGEEISHEHGQMYWFNGVDQLISVYYPLKIEYFSCRYIKN